MAEQILKWRYSKGGLLAEDVTRDAVYAFQQALWDFEGSPQKYHVIRRARKIVLISMRADIGLGEDISGQSIYKIGEKRQNIGSELASIQTPLGIKRRCIIWGQIIYIHARTNVSNAWSPPQKEPLT
ncbi:MAG: hypothetical protein IPL28_25525 [Chloroflexi bacterium]|nr:hypothetical protein [Chloroflexota bacterium]